MFGAPSNLRERGRLVLAVAGGAGWGAAFPHHGAAGLAWVAPGLILLAASGSKAPFRTGYLAGMASYLISLHWLLNIPVPVYYPMLGWLALSGYLAVYPATWCWLCARLQAGSPEASENSWLRRQGWALFSAASWVALEVIQAHLFTGFPWTFLGVTQYKQIPLIQIASVAGIYGVSFLVAWLSVSLWLAAARLVRSPGQRMVWLPELAPAALAVVGVLALGWTSVSSSSLPHRPTLQIALVQPSIPQTMIWDEKESEARFQRVLDLSRVALATRPTLMIWPEATVPRLLRYDRDLQVAITNLVCSHRTWLLLGSDDAERRGTNEVAYFNSSFLISPRGELVASYRKRQLVIFGEYIPMVRWLPFVKRFTPIESGFESGTHPVPFDLPEHRVRTSVLICFEDVFPHLVREYATPDTDFLVNITNDGWFRESAAQWQHAANAVFRAVENGLPLVRCANNGLTCWIDEKGGMHEVYFGDSKDIYGAGFKTAAVPLRGQGRSRPPTFYNRYGDWLPWSCLVLCGIHAFSPLRAWRSRRAATAPSAIREAD